MTWPNFPLVSQIDALVISGDFHTPNSISIGVSDCFGVSITASRIRFSRPVSDGQGFEAVNPGARVRFTTNSSRVDILLRYTNLITRQDTYNGVGAVYANGALVSIFDRGQGAASQIIGSYDFGSVASRLIEVEMPYCASVDFEGVYVVAGSSFSTPPARSATRYLAIGDSITHGFNGSSERLTWPSLLAQSKGWQLHNHGYGGRQLTVADAASALGGMPGAPSVATYLIGFNNFYPQTSLTAFRTDYDAFIASFRAAAPSCKLYCITPTWTNHLPGDGLVVPGSNFIEDYRQKVRDAVAAAGSSYVILVEGESLAVGNLAHFPDSIHPNTVASSDIATALASTMFP